MLKLLKMRSEKATERELIFINLVNGVPIADVAKAFHKETENQVMEDFRFVALKIKNYMFARAMPFISLDTVAEAMQNKLQAFELLNKVNLDVLPQFQKITANKIEDVYT